MIVERVLNTVRKIPSFLHSVPPLSLLFLPLARKKEKEKENTSLYSQGHLWTLGPLASISRAEIKRMQQHHTQHATPHPLTLCGAGGRLRAAGVLGYPRVSPLALTAVETGFHLVAQASLSCVTF